MELASNIIGILAKQMRFGLNYSRLHYSYFIFRFGFSLKYLGSTLIF